MSIITLIVNGMIGTIGILVARSDPDYEFLTFFLILTVVPDIAAIIVFANYNLTQKIV